MTPSPSDCRTCKGLGFLAYDPSSDILCPACRGRGTAPTPTMPPLPGRTTARLVCRRARETAASPGEEWALARMGLTARGGEVVA